MTIFGNGSTMTCVDEFRGGQKMRIIGRKAEQEKLRQCESSRKSELVCVYGRRRVGKTYLVEQTFSERFAFRATGVEGGNTRTQLKSFHQRLRAYGDSSRTIPSDWFEAFSRLERLLADERITTSSHGKKIVFFDEFPWFATARSDFLAAFGEFWNRCGTAKGDLLFIVCGSATSWMIGNLIENSGSLYNRVTCQIFLRPFSLKETELYFRDREFDWSRKQIAECQMIFGGLPYFFDLLNANESLSWNIDTLCLRPGALLRHESNRLLEATLKKSRIYGDILHLLAKHPNGLEKTACQEMLGVAAGSFSRAVDELIKCGYIWVYKEYYRKNHPHRLRIVDPFLLFHYHFLAEAESSEIRDFQPFVNEEGRYMNWRGHAFENLCMCHIDEIKKSLGISGVETVVFPWESEKHQGGAQVDLVIERKDQITNLCEMKYTDQPFAISAEYERNLLNKMTTFKEETKTKHALKTVLISSDGLAGSAHRERISHVITLDDLFDA